MIDLYEDHGISDDAAADAPPNVDRLDVAGGLNPGLSEPGN